MLVKDWMGGLVMPTDEAHGPVPSVRVGSTQQSPIAHQAHLRDFRGQSKGEARQPEGSIALAKDGLAICCRTIHVPDAQEEEEGRAVPRCPEAREPLLAPQRQESRCPCHQSDDYDGSAEQRTTWQCKSLGL